MSEALDALTEQVLKGGPGQIIGEVMGSPRLLRSDGINMQYCVDVRIEHQTELLRNIPIASAVGGQLQFAENGYAVIVKRSLLTGALEVIGPSSTKPGFYHRIAVDVLSGTAGATQNVGYTSRPLTLGELQTYGGGFGRCPLGAMALFDSTGTFVRFL